MKHNATCGTSSDPQFQLMYVDKVLINLDCFTGTMMEIGSFEDTPSISLLIF